MKTDDYYEILAKKLDHALQGLSPLGTIDKVSETWMEYLKVLVDPEDVKYLIELSVFPLTMSVRKFAKKINKTEEEAQKIMDKLFHDNLVMVVGSTKKKYGLQLPMGIFDFPPLSYHEMTPEKAKKLAQLSYKYLVDEEWYRNFEGSNETPLTRVIPIQEAIKSESIIKPYEEIEKIIDNARVLGLQKCVCRLRYEYLEGRKCEHKYPLDTCIAVDIGARHFIERGHAKEISKEEAKKLLKQFGEMGLVHTTENFKEGSHSLICSCCKCCCSLLGGITRWDNPRAVAKANFIANAAEPEKCTQCNLCVDNCPFEAIQISNFGPIIDKVKCMGCGVCAANCPENVLELKKVEREVIYSNIAEMGFKVAKETGKDLSKMI